MKVNKYMYRYFKNGDIYVKETVVLDDKGETVSFSNDLGETIVEPDYLTEKKGEATTLDVNFNKVVFDRVFLSPEKVAKYLDYPTLLTEISEKEYNENV